MKSAWSLPHLKTQNLLLRPITEEDAPSIFEYASNPKVSLYTSWEPHRELGDSLAFIRDYVFPKYEQRLPGPFAITLLPRPDRCIGTIGCFWISEKNRTMEMAYALAEPFWGKGLVVEAGTAVLDYAFETHPVERIQSTCITQNTPSARVMEKLGMTLEGTLRSYLYQRGRSWDMHILSILRQEHLGRDREARA